ncbi:MAG: hypothetical protein ABUS79_01210 [Pseudomonadota bacterium]
MPTKMFPRSPINLALSARKPALAVSLALSLALGACAPKDDADEFREGVPLREDVTIVVPGASTQQSALTTSGGGVAEIKSALLGERADLYKLTRDITFMVNGGTAAVLTLVKTITEYPPSSVGMDVAVWGPHTNPLSPNTWRLTVNRLGPGQFQYTLEAKPKTANDTAYLTILAGHHNVANPGTHRRGHNLPAFGSGDFDVDWDAAQMLPEHDDNVGKAHFVYSRPSATSDVSIDVTFTQVMDDETGMLIDAQYGYVETPGAGGSFQFTLTKNAIVTTAALETLTVRSRWQETGAGRSDVKFGGGDLGATQATASECWDTNFLSVYQTNSYGDAAKMWGAESSCEAAFATPDYAVF